MTTLVEDHGLPLISIGEPMTTLDEAWTAVEAWCAAPGHPDAGLYEVRVGRWGQAPDYWAEAWVPDISPDGMTCGVHARGASPIEALQNLRSLLENPGGTE